MNGLLVFGLKGVDVQKKEEKVEGEEEREQKNHNHIAPNVIRAPYRSCMR